MPSRKPRPPLPAGGDCFPRTTDHPPQSPLFWVQQKDRYLRQRLIRDIEEETGRRLLVFFCNRFVRDSEISASDVAPVVELFGDALGQPVDLFIETPGGETDATEAVLSVITQSVPEFRAIIPNAAKSNGTLIALHARTILMSAASELGPIEPSLGGIPCSTLIMNEVKAQNLPIHVAAKHAMRQTQDLALRALRNGMMKGKPEEAIREAVDALSTRETYPVHGSVIDSREARALGLKVTRLAPDSALWRKIWLLFCMYDFDARRDRLAKIFEGNTRSLSFTALPEAGAG